MKRLQLNEKTQVTFNETDGGIIISQENIGGSNTVVIFPEELKKLLEKLKQDD